MQVTVSGWDGCVVFGESQWASSQEATKVKFEKSRLNLLSSGKPMNGPNFGIPPLNSQERCSPSEFSLDA